VVVCGEIGGSDEEDAAAFNPRAHAGMPIVAFIGGRTPRPEVARPRGRDHSALRDPGVQIKAFTEAGVPVADRPSAIPALLAERMAATVCLPGLRLSAGPQ